ISAVVLDASDERRARFEDLSVEFVVEIAAINDVQTSRPEHRPEPIGLRAGRYGNGGIDRDAAEDVEVEMKLDSSMLGVLPQGPSHTRKRTEDAAVHGSEMEQFFGVWPVDNGRSLPGQFAEDLVKRLGVEQPRGFAEGTQGRRTDSPSSLDGLEGGSLLQA